MTSKETQERNREIALMLGWSLVEYPTHMKSPFHGRSVWWSPGTTKTFCCFEGKEFFHSDWTWLMGAKRFAEKNGFDISIRGFDIMVYRPFRKRYNVRLVEPKLDADVDDSSITEAVFIAVSDFAKLYNEGKL